MPEALDITEGIKPKEAITLEILAERVTEKNTIFVEIGSWKGHSASIIGRVARNMGGHLYCVDHWNGCEGTSSFHISHEQDIYSIFEHNMKVLHLWDCIIPLRMESLKAYKQFDDNSIDFLFIDADHRYTPFLSDLKAWYPKVKDGGIICGHDCETKYSEAFPELKERIDEHLEVDFDGNYHCGVIKGLYDFFNDDYAQTGDIRIWMKRR